jgi:tocopherol cyclase
MGKINKLYNCGIFQGEHKKKHYFEGWYFKHVDRDEENILSVIPGIAYEDSREKSHAFIQIIDGTSCKTHYVRYETQDFSFCKDQFQFRIGRSTFGQEGISLDIEAPDIRLKGKLAYANRIAWPSRLLSPNSMGWYGFIPFMECYHGVLSLQHDISGGLLLNDREIRFDGGRGYMEKDWGTSFPSSWIWLQSNHFDVSDTGFMLSVARIPWQRSSFTGFMGGLRHKDKIYRFATYTGAKITQLEHQGHRIRLTLSDKNYLLNLQGLQGDTGALQAPQKGAMTTQIQESIRGVAEIRLLDKKRGALLLLAQARCCGMELAGNIQELLGDN